MPRHYPPEYFASRIQQSKIKQAILDSLISLDEVYYHNLIIATAELLAEFTRQAFSEEIFNKDSANDSPQ